MADTTVAPDTTAATDAPDATAVASAVASDPALDDADIEDADYTELDGDVTSEVVGEMSEAEGAVAGRVSRHKEGDRAGGPVTGPGGASALLRLDGLVARGEHGEDGVEAGDLEDAADLVVGAADSQLARRTAAAACRR